MARWRLSTFYFFYFTIVGVITPFWGLYLHSLDFSPTQIGQLMAILLVSKVVLPNMWAVVADRLAMQRGNSIVLIQFATLFAALIYFLIFYAKGFWQFAAVMLGFCVFWNACLPQLEAATMNALADKRHYGRVRLWGSISFIIVVLALGYVIDWLGAQAIGWAGALAFGSVFLASLLLKPTSVVVRKHGTQQSVFTLLKDKQILMLMLMSLLMQLSHSPFYTFFAIYMEDFGYAKFEIGLMWTIGVVLEIFIFVYTANILRRFKLLNLLSFTFFIAAVRWLLIGYLPQHAWAIYLAQTAHAITYGLCHVVMIQIIDRLFQGPVQIRGQALYNSIAYGLGGAIGSTLSGLIWSWYGGQSLFIYTGFLMMGVTVLAMVTFKDMSLPKTTSQAG